MIANSGIEVSVMGLGTVKFGRNQGVKYPHTFTLPSDKELTRLLSIAADLGLNLLDTAPAYGSSEERLGKLLRATRHDWVVCTKVGEEFVDGESQYDFSSQTIINSVERSLKRLYTDYLDIVLVHSNGDDERIIKQDGVFQTLEDLKQKGKIRAYGMSTKTVEGGLQTITHADIAMVTYNPHCMEDKAVITSAYQQQKAIFIKKALASGHMPFTLAESMQCIFAEPGVTSVIIGTINPEHLRRNVASVVQLIP
jgi:aryl-alcohol dehydrogenase-like predicted oxidoreductase